MTLGCLALYLGFELLYQPEVVRLYLSLLTESRNFNTLEAAAGALQNLSAGNWMVRSQVGGEGETWASGRRAHSISSGPGGAEHCVAVGAVGVGAVQGSPALSSRHLCYPHSGPHISVPQCARNVGCQCWWNCYSLRPTRWCALWPSHCATFH